MTGLKIILVEDKDSWQGILREDLERVLKSMGRSGGHLESITSFEKAYSALTMQTWNLLVTDIGLGGERNEGIQLVTRAHELNIPSIVVSGTSNLTNQDVADLLQKHKASYFFSKGKFDDSIFIAKAKELLQIHAATTNVLERSVDFAIVTAIDVERKAVCKALGFTAKNRIQRGARVYWKGSLILPKGNFYEIVVAQLADMANVDAALSTNDLIHHWQPGSILLVAIAGAASNEEQLGDLVLGSHVYYYERGKEMPAGKRAEPYMYPADSTLWNRITTLPDWNARISARRPDGTNNRPKIYQGVIASGEKVIADVAVRDEIKSGQRKIRAIEMEGYGVSKATWQTYDHVRHLVIRAISDSADPQKNDKWHQYAATVAAEYARFFLRDCPLLPRNSEGP
jgi:nucleoside phosphorylase